MTIQAWLLTSGITVYAERTAVEFAEERVYGETNLYVELNTRLVVDDFYTAVRDKLEASEPIPIFTSTIELAARTFDPTQVAWIEPDGGADCIIYLRSSRKVKVTGVTALAAAEAFGYVA